MKNPVLIDFLEDWGIYAGLLVLILLAITVITTFVIAEKNNRKYRMALDDQSNSVRVFVIDLRNDKVQFFNVTRLQDIHHCTVSEFYQQFPISEQKRVINWINALADSTTEAPEYLEANIQESRTRRHYFSMLQVESVDYDKQIIHLQSYLLKYMSASKGDGADSTHGLTTMKEVEGAMLSEGTKHGLTVAFRFAHKRITDKDKEIEPLTFNQFKNALSPFMQSKRYLMQASGNELVFVDLRTDGKAKAMYFVRSCLNAINRYLSLNSLAGSYEVRAGVVEHRRFAEESERIISNARRLANEAYGEKEQVLWYERGRRTLRPTDDSSYRTEVERIINEKKLRYLFRPVFSVVEGKVVGYLTKAEPVDTYFDSMDDLKDYAMRTEDDRSLCQTVAKETVQRFLSERPSEDQALFYPVRLVERGYMLVTFARLTKSRSAHLVMLFDESDIADQAAKLDEDALISDLRATKAKGYNVALRLNSSQLQLEPKVYSVFDYFVCSFAFEGAEREGNSTTLRSHLHSLVEKLLKYQKPIIASDFEGWPAVELMVRSGLEYISSEAFAPYDVMMNPVNPKFVKRVKDMKN